MPHSISLWSAISPHVSVLTSNRPRCISWRCRDDPCLARTWPGSIQVRLATNPVSVCFFMVKNHGLAKQIKGTPLKRTLSSIMHPSSQQLLVPVSRAFWEAESALHWPQPYLTSYWHFRNCIQWKKTPSGVPALWFYVVKLQKEWNFASDQTWPKMVRMMAFSDILFRFDLAMIPLLLMMCPLRSSASWTAILLVASTNCSNERCFPGFSSRFFNRL